MRENPRLEDYPDDSPVRAKMLEFNVRHCDMLRTRHCALNGEPTKLDSVVSQMMDIRATAGELMLMPTGDGVTIAGPSFDYVAAPGADGSRRRSFGSAYARMAHTSLKVMGPS